VFFPNADAKKMSISLLSESVPTPLESGRVGTEWIRLAGRRLSKECCCMGCLSGHSTIVMRCLPARPKIVHVVCL